MVMPRQGDIWWAERPDHKGRPYLVLTRDSAIDVLSAILVAPLTTTIRDIPTELPLGAADGLGRPCVATFDNLITIRRAHLVRRVARLSDGRWHEVCDALRAAIDC
jgi:mRNA interferase MazF